MAFTSDHTGTDLYDQQSNRHVILSRYAARLAEYSAVEVDPSPTKHRHGSRMFFDMTCVPELPVLSPGDSYPHASFFIPESFAATSPSPADQSCMSTVNWAPESGGIPSPTNETDVKVKKDRRRAQNRVAQRGEPLLDLITPPRATDRSHIQAFRDRKEKAIESLTNELQRLLAINQYLSKANEAYAAQISDLKKTIESTKLLETPPSSAPTCDPFFELDELELEHGFADSLTSLQADCGESWIHWQEGDCMRLKETTTAEK